MKGRMDMRAEAIEKLNKEMDGANNNPYVQVIGKFLLQHIESNPDDAGKILAADKTIAKSLDAMRKAAEKVKVGNMAMLSDEEGYRIVLQYFGIEGQPTAATSPPVEPKPTAGAAFDVKLDDFM